jgi:hypothetical protein
MLIRVTEPGRPASQLRKGEIGISVFDTAAVEPPLTESEILASFRPGSEAANLLLDEVRSKGLQVVSIPGAEPLPERLRIAHAEIRPGIGMSRPEFKKKLQELD